MKFKENIGQRVLLLTSFALIIPLLFFPKLFGTQLAKFSVVNFLYEMVFYGLVIFLFHRRTSLWKLVLSAGLCLVYRLGLSVVFGAMIFALYSITPSISLMLGVYGYLPGVIFYALVTPFVIKPWVDRVVGEEVEKSPKPDRNAALRTFEPPPSHSSVKEETEPTPTHETPVAAMTAPKQKHVPVKRKTAPVMASPDPAPVHEPPRNVPPTELNGFERAIRYIGEHAAVHLATVVDHEGLMLAHFKRGNIDPDAWAPLALVFFESNMQVLRKTTSTLPEKIDIVLKDNRVVVARVGKASLMVVAERQSDDFLNIRINQGLDIIKKYIEERYSRIFVEKEDNEEKMEKINVSSTQ